MCFADFFCLSTCFRLENMLGCLVGALIATQAEENELQALPSTTDSVCKHFFFGVLEGHKNVDLERHKLFQFYPGWCLLPSFLLCHLPLGGISFSGGSGVFKNTQS